MSWFKDRHFKSLLKNSGYIAASKGVSAVSGLATLAFAGRALGVELFGVLILIVSYAKAASGLSRFQSWQLIIRYGGHGVATGDPADFKTSTGFAFALDVVSGIGGMVLAILLLPLIGHLFGITEDRLLAAMLYCAILPTMSAATPVGVLRALDRFDLLSLQGSAYPIARAILAGIAWWTEAPFETFVAIYFVTDLGGDILQWWLAWRELRRRDLLSGIRPTLRPTNLAGAWRFAIHVNLTTSLMAAWGPVARLVVGGLLGPAGAGIYRVAGSLADAGQRPADVLAKAYYPEIVRMDLKSSAPWQLMLRGTVFATGVGAVALLLLLLGGEALVGGIFGKDFLPAYPVLLVLMIAPLIGIVSFPLTPLLYAFDRPDGPLKARLIGTILYFVIIAPMCWRYGIVGAGWAYVAASTAMALVLAVLVIREHRAMRAA